VETWQELAECRKPEHQSVDWMPEERQGRGRRLAEVRAVGVCMRCPVRSACLLDAFDQSDDFGVRGGMTGSERRKVRPRKRVRGPDRGVRAKVAARG
jgi:WhiB family redox-sensing transcriptional regulator